MGVCATFARWFPLPENGAEMVLAALYITEKCDGCGELLNQTVRWTITGQPEVYCSAECRDLAFFEGRREVKMRATPGAKRESRPGSPESLVRQQGRGAFAENSGWDRGT